MPVGPAKQAYLDRVKAAQAARAAKTPSPVVEAAMQSVKQVRRRRYHQPFNRNGGTGGGTGGTGNGTGGGLGFGGLTTPTTSGTGGSSSQLLGPTLSGGKGFQKSFTPKSGWGGVQLGGGGFAL